MAISRALASLINFKLPILFKTASRIFQSEGKGNVDASCVLFRSSN